MNTPDEFESPIKALLDNDYEARGFRILARMVARNLLKRSGDSGRIVYLKTNDSPAMKDDK